MRTNLQAHVEQKIGRNLLRYQLVELRLKHALPFRRVTISAKGLDTLGDDVDAQSKFTLGRLLPGYAEAFEISPPEAKQAFQAELDAFLRARNRLVHHLLQDHTLLTTTEACQACMARLDEDYQLAEAVSTHVLELHRFVLQSVQAFVDAMRECPPGPLTGGDVLQRHAALLAQMHGPNVQIEIQAPLSVVLAEVMKVIEGNYRRDDGWTLFHHVGTEIHSRAPEVRATLSMARQLDGFELKKRPPRPGAGTTWMFRSRAANGT